MDKSILNMKKNPSMSSLRPSTWSWGLK